MTKRNTVIGGYEVGRMPSECKSLWDKQPHSHDNFYNHIRTLLKVYFFNNISYSNSYMRKLITVYKLCRDYPRIQNCSLGITFLVNSASKLTAYIHLRPEVQADLQ